MGASGWSYFVPYQPDRYLAFVTLRQQVFENGDYWWALAGGTAAGHPDRPRTEDELWSSETVRESGTHSILDMYKVLDDGEEPNYGYLPYEFDDFTTYMSLVKQHGNPDYGVIVPVTGAEAQATVGTTRLTRDHVKALHDLARYRGIGRCAVLHDPMANPAELYFWGFSGD